MKQLSKRSLSTVTESQLSYSGTYTCPICRHGAISELTLTEAFACNFCHHIFTANLQQQLIQVADSSQSMSWRWTGSTWKPTHQRDTQLTSVLWLLGICLIVFPPFLIWLSAYTFPPAEGSTAAWIPTLWIGLAFLSHLVLVGWLIAEVYQFPIYAVVKVKLRRWLRQ